MTVIGLFGIIGTVEYLEAQTILSIPPTNIPAVEQHISLTLQTTSPTNVWLTPSNNTMPHRFDNEGDTIIGHIHLTKDPLIKTNPIWDNIETTSCGGNFISVKIQLAWDNAQGETAVPHLIVPDNITPQGNDSITAMGFNWNNNCTPNYETQTDETTPLLMRDGKELRYTITGKHDKKPYYFSPRDNITQAQPIPACTTETFDTTTQTLKGTQEMCYGKNGNDMVIITKRPLGFYGVADTVSTPTNVVDFTGTPATQPNTPANPNNDSDEYTALLKRLYLPAI